jgi:hypothetical protein
MYKKIETREKSSRSMVIETKETVIVTWSPPVKSEHSKLITNAISILPHNAKP